jgi:polyphosphate:AMP phosphotransferase
MWRFWRSLPPKGKIGIFFGSWYTEPIIDHVFQRLDADELERRTAEIERFERMLVNEGALVVKLWFHLAKKVQKKRLRTLEANPKTSWHVSDTEWEHFKRYDQFRVVSERVLRHTSTVEAPWTVIEGANARYRELTAGETLLHAMQERLQEASRGERPEERDSAPPASSAMVSVPSLDGVQLLRSLDLSQTLSKSEYDDELAKEQRKIALLSRDKSFKKHSLVLVFEGVDAAGKGGSIRRVTSALDARQYRIVPIGAPTEEERAQPYLWRFWRHLPRRGHATIFDRSWYGRVLVERVEEFAPKIDWMRAYEEINDFEEQLVQSGTIVVKLWLQISQAEQLKRFKARERVGFKRYKITDEDWRNRKKWPEYESAICDMIDRTSTEIAPWTLVEAENKRFARIKVLRTVREAIERSIQSTKATKK